MNENLNNNTNSTNAHKPADEAINIDIRRLIQTWIYRWWAIALVAAIFAVGTFVYSSVFVTKMYRSSVMIYVNNSRNSDSNDFVSSGNISASKELVGTYIKIINSDSVLRRVIKEKDLGLTTSQLRSMISASQVEDTELFMIYVSSSDPMKAYKVAHALGTVAPNVIEEYIVGSSAKMIDDAVIATNPYSPNPPRNAFVGAMIGAVLVIAYLTLQQIFDTRILTEADLENVSELPILGKIPEFIHETEAEEKKPEETKTEDKEKTEGSGKK